VALQQLPLVLLSSHAICSSPLTSITIGLERARAREELPNGPRGVPGSAQWQISQALSDILATKTVSVAKSLSALHTSHPDSKLVSQFLPSTFSLARAGQIFGAQNGFSGKFFNAQRAALRIRKHSSFHWANLPCQARALHSRPLVPSACLKWMGEISNIRAQQVASCKCCPLAFGLK